MEDMMGHGKNKGKFGGNSGRRDSTPRTHGGKRSGGPGKNAQHKDSSNHSKSPKGNRPTKGRVGR